MSKKLSKKALTAIYAAFEFYNKTLAAELTKNAASAFVAGDLIAQELLSITVGNQKVQDEALEFVKEYGQLLRGEGASVIGGEKIYWLKDSTDKTREAVLNVVTQGLEDGLSMPELGQLIMKTLPGMLESKANVIARTEVARIQNTATLNRFGKLKVSKVLVIDNEGPNSCVACSQANGQTWTVEYAATHELEHPNCVRSFAPLLPDDWVLPE